MLVNIALFAVWVALVDIWIARHFPESTNLFLFLPAIAPVFIKVFEYLTDEAEREATEKGFKEALKKLLTFRVITVLYLSFALFSLFFTSLTISPVSDGKEVEVKLIRLGELESEMVKSSNLEKSLNFNFIINPLKTDYQLSISGYVPTIVSVPPFFGKTVIPERDLKKLPTLLFRPSIEANEMMINNGWFELYSRDRSGIFKKIIDDEGGTAWVVGAFRQQPKDLLALWQLELAGWGLKDATATAKLLLNWQMPKRLVRENSTINLEPGQFVCGLITNKERKEYFYGVLTKVSNDEYIDISLRKLNSKDVKDENGSARSGVALCDKLSQSAIR